MSRSIAELLATIRKTPGCCVRKPQGLPTLPADMSLPSDLREFYELAGEVLLFPSSFFDSRVRILPPGEFQRIDLAINGEMFATGPFPWWYAIADVRDGNFVTIDLNPQHFGLCYDAFHETFAMPGYVKVVATSFSDFLERLLPHGDDSTYWLQEEFESLGEAFSLYGYEPLN